LAVVLCSTALEPKLGKQTLTIHHDKHHAKYVTVANQVIIASS
jgi:superoxide dismutase